MRRLATVLPATLAALVLLTAPALAAGPHAAHTSTSKQASAEQRSGHDGKAGKAGKDKKDKKDKKEKSTPKKAHDITLSGVLSDTPTATMRSDSSTATMSSDSSTSTMKSDTATTTIVVFAKGGSREFHHKTVKLVADGKTVVRRGDGRATLADLRKGDHVSIKARRLADGTLYAYRINAAPRHDAEDDD